MLIYLTPQKLCRSEEVGAESISTTIAAVREQIVKLRLASESNSEINTKLCHALSEKIDSLGELLSNDSWQRRSPYLVPYRLAGDETRRSQFQGMSVATFTHPNILDDLSAFARCIDGEQETVSIIPQSAQEPLLYNGY